jgi:hypothetical protein
VLTAENLRDRQAEDLSFEVPKRHVDRTDRERGDALDAVPVGVRAHPVPQHVDIHRVGADDERREALVDEDLRRAGRFGELTDRLTPPHDTVA